MVAEEGDADVAVEDSVVEVDSAGVEVSVEQDSVEVTEVAVGDSVVIGEGSAVAAEPGVLEEDSEVEEVDAPSKALDRLSSRNQDEAISRMANNRAREPGRRRRRTDAAQYPIASAPVLSQQQSYTFTILRHCNV